MTTSDSSPADDLPASRAGATNWQRFEHWLERCGEHLNPILIKEARQALKSRQFVVTFALVLGAAWCWSLIGLAIVGPQVYYGTYGADLLFGYAVILLFALVIVVPYGAFRSLAGELEDRSYELVSITSLKARQIIGGKLATSWLQILVFLSAVSPCIAFTYLLRGVDILTILMLVVYSALASLGLSLGALLLASCSLERYRQVVASVILVLGLGGLFLAGCGLAADLLRTSPAFNPNEFFAANGVLLTVYASYFVLLYLAAAAQLSFTSSNRSTAARIVMFVQQGLLAGWMAVSWLEGPRELELLLVLLVLSGIHWYAMGVFLIGEPQRLSLRVQRDLPQSFLGRALFTWFNPGSGTGLMFALANFLAVVLLALGLTPLGPVRPFSTTMPLWNPEQRVFYLGLCGFCYLTIYLGLGKLLLDLVRPAPTEGVGVVLRVALCLLLLVLGTAIPLVIQMSLDDLRQSGYSLLHISNPFWTIAELCNPFRSPPAETEVLVIALPAAAALVLLVNLRRVVAEVRQVRIARPTRVVEAEALESPPPVPTGPSSPWG